MITMQTFQLKIIKQALILITPKNIAPYIMLMFSSRHIQKEHDNKKCEIKKSLRHLVGCVNKRNQFSELKNKEKSQLPSIYLSHA